MAEGEWPSIMQVVRAAVVLLTDIALVVRTRRRRLVITSVAGRVTGTFYPPQAQTSAAPGILVLHTAGGRTPHEDAAGARLARAGFGALVVEYSGRTSGSVAKDANRLTELIEIARAAIEALQDQPEVDGQRVAVLGYSLGGCLALHLVVQRAVGAAAIYYGVYSTEAARADQWAPVLIHQGDRDDAGFVERAKALTAVAAAEGRTCILHLHAGAGHQFDLFDPGGAAAKEAWSATLSFLASSLMEPQTRAT